MSAAREEADVNRAIRVLAMVAASMQHRRRWLILLIVLTALVLLVVGINGILETLGVVLSFDEETFLRHQASVDSVVAAAVVVTLLVSLAALIFTLRAAPVKDSEPVVASATKPPAARQP
jgi:hypothetical protein